MPPWRQKMSPEMAAIVAAYRLQADKDNAQLRMKEDEIQLLRTQLTVPPRNTTGKTAAKLSAPVNSRLTPSAPRWVQRRLMSSRLVALRS